MMNHSTGELGIREHESEGESEESAREPTLSEKRG